MSATALFIRARGVTVERRVVTAALPSYERALCYSYKHRKTRKRDMRSLWIMRINAAVRSVAEGLTYSRFMFGLRRAGISLTARCWPILRCGKKKLSAPLYSKLMAV